MSYESIEQLPPPIQVKFRWFRTVETVSPVVTLSYTTEGKKCNRLKLVWDKLKMLYESSPAPVQCGRHRGDLHIDDKVLPLREFGVVPATFEVNLFLQQERIYADDDVPMASPMKYRIGSYSPLSVETAWPNLGFDGMSLGSAEFVVDRPSSESSRSRQSYNIYEELISSKDREIQLLRQELKDLKLVLLNLEEDVNESNTRNYIESTETKNITAELHDLQREKKSLELETEELTHRVEDTEEARESLEWEVEQLRERLSGNDPAEVAHLLEEMKSLRQELRSACKKNVELGEEVLTLREANSKLARASSNINRVGVGNGNDTVYFSDQDSEGTRYRELPTKMELSFSLPALGSPKHATTPRRRATSLVKELPPLESSSVRSEESSLDGEPLNYPESPVPVSVSGTQTDITAVLGEPRLYRSAPSPSCGNSRHSKDVRKRNVFRKTTTESTRLPESRFRPECESSDTEELLEEAEAFIQKSMLSESSFLHASVNIRNSKVTENEKFSSSLVKNVLGKSIELSGNICNVASRKSVFKLNRPFIPKSASDVATGDVIRYHGVNGRIVHGTVRRVELDSNKYGYSVCSESPESQSSSFTSSRIFVPFKKVILAMEV